MITISDALEKIFADDPVRIIASKAASGSAEYKKITAERKNAGWQLSAYTEKQVFHENVSPDRAMARLTERVSGNFRQLNAWGGSGEHIVLISKDGKCSCKLNRTAQKQTVSASHDRKKEYLLPEGEIIAPLVDMGVFTAEGKVVRSMYDKYRQINRFLEIINDELGSFSAKQLNIIDFGCGKSYLTFIVYYYLHEKLGLDVNVIGLDLKADVIAKCNAAAQRYGYDGLRFEVGDINGFRAPFDVDMVMTLHACDTATDYALYNAVQWGAKMIFSVPCCQHELNAQIRSDRFSALTRYGIVRERFSALATDAIRADLLEYRGYRTQLLEFIDFEHTPKNILIRAVKRPVTPPGIRKRALREVQELMEEFRFDPTAYRLLGPGADAHVSAQGSETASYIVEEKNEKDR